MIVIHWIHLDSPLEDSRAPGGQQGTPAWMDGCQMRGAPCACTSTQGVNNAFLIKSHDPLALLYNDASPMVGGEGG